MICPLCYKEIPVGKLIKPYIAFQGGGEIEICGQCHLLICIFETLKEIKDGLAR